MLTLRDYQDELIRDAGIETRTSRKWSATEAVKQTENTLRHKEIVGVTAVGRQGIGQQTQFSVEPIRPKGEVRSKESRGTYKTSKGRRDGSTGSMDHVEHHRQELTWGDIWKYEPLWFSFLLRSVYDLLSSPANLCRWGLTTDPKCSLCDKPGTLEHVLSSCSTALTQGRYTTRSSESWLTGWRRSGKRNMVITPNTDRLPLSSQVIPERHRQHNLHCIIVV